jgi:hypothetical protein
MRRRKRIPFSKIPKEKFFVCIRAFRGYANFVEDNAYGQECIFVRKHAIYGFMIIQV